MEKAELREAFHKIFALSSVGNKKFQDGEPWKGIKEKPEATAAFIRNLTYLVRDLAILLSPYIPATSLKIGKTLGIAELKWADLATFVGIGDVEKPELLFTRLEDKEIEALRVRFSVPKRRGKRPRRPRLQARLLPKSRDVSEHPWISVPAKIVEIRRHPDAEKLFVETVDLGTEKRTIVSGLVPHYKEEELLGHTVVLVANLKPAILRGVESQGMLLAGQEDKTVDVLFVDHAAPGDRVTLGETSTAAPTAQIDVDTFFTMPIAVANGKVVVGDATLITAGNR